jgi:hypothetical protein
VSKLDCASFKTERCTPSPTQQYSQLSLEIVSESDCELLPSSFYYRGVAEHQPRSLKPSLQIYTWVCQLWRELTLSRPSFWVTKLTIIGGDDEILLSNVSQAEQLLETSSGSDIDFLASSPSQIGQEACFQRFMDWLDMHLYPVSHRVRKYELQGGIMTTSGLDQLLGHFQAHQSWPRLQVLQLFSSNTMMEMDYSQLSAPNLRLVSLNGIVWKNRLPSFLLPHSTLDTFVLNIDVGESVHPSIHHSKTLSSLLSSSPPTLFANLNELVLQLRDHLLPEALPELYFTQMSWLSITVWRCENAWTLLKIIHAPQLVELHLVDTARSSSLSIPPHESIHLEELHNLQRLRLLLPACWLLLFLVALPARHRITTLCLISYSPREEPYHRTLRAQLSLNPITFENLQNVELFFAKEFLFPIDMIANAANHVSLDPFNMQPTILANAKKMTVSGHEACTSLEAPSLEYLAFNQTLTTMDNPHKEGQGAKTFLGSWGGLSRWVEKANAHRIPLSNVKTRELRICNRTILAPGDLIPFTCLENLILNWGSNHFQPLLFHWANTELPTREVYIPQLKTLTLNFMSRCSTTSICEGLRLCRDS